MSFQFEDDSTLDELLNQQLDRRKQSSLATSKDSQRKTNARPSTASLVNKNDVENIPERSEKTPMASWLGLKAKPVVVSNSGYRGSTEGYPEVSLKDPDIDSSVQVQSSVDLQLSELDESRLQLMSKQGLLNLIRSKIVPKLSSVRENKTPDLEQELERVKAELEAERAKSTSILLNQVEQVQLIESKWIQLNKQLESRSVDAEQNLIKAAERHKNQVAELEAEHKVHLEKVVHDCKIQLEELSMMYESKMKRKDELHELEINSKLRVKGDMMKLESVFGDWQQMMQSTVRELNAQYKSIESLLDKQTIEINSTNEDLARKTKSVVEQQTKFALQSEQLDDLVTVIGKKVLPQLESSSSENQRFIEEAMERLTELSRCETELKERERAIAETKSDLVQSLKETSEEKFRLGLEDNRLNYERERLEERAKALDHMEVELNERKRALVQGEGELACNRASLDSKLNELKEQNYEVHLSRKKVLERQEELELLSCKVKKNQRALGEQVSELQVNSRKFNELRDRTLRELDQLKRLQKSLVCSICNERLFAATRGTSKIKTDRYDDEHVNNERFISDYSRYIKQDLNKLGQEDRYVGLLKQDV